MAVSGNPLSVLDRRRIDVCDDDELSFWTREFGVGNGELYEAIRTVGTSVRFVRAYLQQTTGSARWAHGEGRGISQQEISDGVNRLQPRL